jgi:hypothetical protein
MTRQRRSASDALASTQVKPEEVAPATPDDTKPDETTPATTEVTPAVTPEVDVHGSDVDGKVDSPEAAAQDVDPATPGDFAAVHEDDQEDEESDATVSVIVVHDAFNYFEDGVHLTAKKGERIDLEEHQVDRAVGLGAVRKADKD